MNYFDIIALLACVVLYTFFIFSLTFPTAEVLVEFVGTLKLLDVEVLFIWIAPLILGEELWFWAVTDWVISSKPQSIAIAVGAIINPVFIICYWILWIIMIIDTLYKTDNAG